MYMHACFQLEQMVKPVGFRAPRHLVSQSPLCELSRHTMTKVLASSSVLRSRILEELAMAMGGGLGPRAGNTADVVGVSIHVQSVAPLASSFWVFSTLTQEMQSANPS
jgi:hypothetical protein